MPRRPGRRSRCVRSVPPVDVRGRSCSSIRRRSRSPVRPDVIGTCRASGQAGCSSQPRAYGAISVGSISVIQWFDLAAGGFDGTLVAEHGRASSMASAFDPETSRDGLPPALPAVAGNLVRVGVDDQTEAGQVPQMPAGDRRGGSHERGQRSWRWPGRTAAARSGSRAGSDGPAPASPERIADRRIPERIRERHVSRVISQNSKAQGGVLRRGAARWGAGRRPGGAGPAGDLVRAGRPGRTRKKVSSGGGRSCLDRRVGGEIPAQADCLQKLDEERVGAREAEPSTPRAAITWRQAMKALSPIESQNLRSARSTTMLRDRGVPAARPGCAWRLTGGVGVELAAEA